LAMVSFTQIKFLLIQIIGYQAIKPQLTRLQHSASKELGNLNADFR